MKEENAGNTRGLPGSIGSCGRFDVRDESTYQIDFLYIGNWRDNNKKKNALSIRLFTYPKASVNQ